MIKRKPAGFFKDAWSQFLFEGILKLPFRLPEETVNTLLDQLFQEYGKSTLYSMGGRLDNAVTISSDFEQFIDHEAYIGFIYDLFGDASKVISSSVFVRPEAQDKRAINDWHIDGPRRTPFLVYAPILPLRVKIGIWLTPVKHAKQGCFVYVPGSHFWLTLSEYKTHKARKDEKHLFVDPGEITLMHGNLWHRVLANNEGPTRINMFLEYGPSWVQSTDRLLYDEEWVKSLPRERRILLRNYSYPNHYIKPPQEDIPLYLDGAGATDQTGSRTVSFAKAKDLGGKDSRGSTMIEFQKLSYEVGGQKVLDSFCMTVQDGECLGLYGENGSGKSTIINLVATLITPTGGTYLFDGKNALKSVKQVRSQVALMAGVPLGFYPRLTGMENLQFFALIAGSKPSKEQIFSELRYVGLPPEAWNKKYHQYSLGMKQRLHLARVLLHPGKVSLFDEPTNGLDQEGIDLLREAIKVRISDRTRIVVSHDEEFLESVTNRRLYLKKGKQV